MKLLTKALDRFILVSYDTIKNIVGAVTVATIVIMSVGIASRCMFFHAISWIEEICYLFLVRLCYLSVFPTTVTKEHAVTDFLSGSLSIDIQKTLGSMICIGEIIFFGVVTYGVARLLPEFTNVNAALKLPKYRYYPPASVFGAYMALAIAMDAVNDPVSKYDYFGRRGEEKEKARMEQGRKENLEILKRVDAFMGVGGEEGEGG